MEIGEPFVELVLGAVGEAPDESVFFFKEDLGGGDYDATDWGVEDDLTGESVEGHLVIGFVLVEVVIARSGGGGFVVHDEELIVEGDYSIEVAGQDFGLTDGMAFLKKPYQPSALALKVRECLDLPA